MQKQFEQKVLTKFPNIAAVENYTRAKSPVILRCQQGHRWQVIPSNLISKGTGSNCPACAMNPQYEELEGIWQFSRKKPQDTFAQEVKALNPTLLEVGKYSGAKVPVTLVCACGHVWKVLPTNLLSRPQEASCTVCSPPVGRQQTLDSAQVKIQDKYSNLSLVEYNGSQHECTVLDNSCGHQFTSWYSNLVQGRGYRCTTCEPDYATSKNEQAIIHWLRTQYSGWIVERDRTLIGPKELDIVLPDLGIAIEYNAPYTHQDKDHLHKLQLVEAEGFRLLQVNEDEWNYRQQVVKHKLLAILGKNLVLGARQCTVETIQFPAEFLDQNHLQGRGQPTTHNYGLFYGNELVACMTFAKPRFNHNYTWELIRYCSLGGVTVAGGASRLLKRFQQEHGGTVLSYSDRRWSRGELYRSLGFQHLHSTAPGYAYYKNSHKLSRYQCQKHLLEKLVPAHWDPLLTEHEIMRNAGFVRMYDCGMDVWVL